MKTRGQRSRRSSRKRFAITKKRRQRGGGKLDVQGIGGQLGTKSVIVENANQKTPREIVRVFLEQGAPHLLPTINVQVPPFSFISGSKKITITNWDSYQTLPNPVNLIITALQAGQKREEESTAHAVEILKNLFTCLKSKYLYGKVILESFAEQKDIVKNTGQQFQFNNFPTNPIVLIDSSFTPNNPYDFFNILDIKRLNEQEVVDLFSLEEGSLKEQSCSLPPPGPLIQYYHKPAGVPFRPSPGGDIDYKEKYVCVLKDRAQKENFDEMEELLIVCVIHYLTDKSRAEIIRNAMETNMNVYNWAEYKKYKIEESECI